ncbi:MAG: carboxypeptidase regulatory-like domain-containing protein, partial [Terriglobales bacterium]
MNALRSIGRILFVVVFTAALLTSAFGQNSNSGTVFGVITDESGALVPKASVELKDSATGLVRSATTNEAGRYSFVAVNPGTYVVHASAQGFQAAQSSVKVGVGNSSAVNLSLRVGKASETVEVVGNNAAAELQTTDSTVGDSMGGDTLRLLPSLQRSVSSLLLLQPASMPQQGPNQGSSLGGQVAGSQSDQNSIVLDGSNITNGVSGNSDYYTNFRGGPEPPIPTPLESVEEFKVATNNPNASFAGAAGSQVMLVTKRGSNTFHGSAYEFFQNSALNANAWERNFHNQPRPVTHDNRYGAAFGGYIPKLGGNNKTYFYLNYEGRKQSQAEQIEKLVPSDLMRQGILQFRDNTGKIVQYNLATAALCGPSGTGMCDPGVSGFRGISPVIQNVWNTLPAGNDPNYSGGDGLNTLGYTGAVKLPVSENFGVARLDRALTQNWQLMTSFRYFEQEAAVDKQIDIAGLLKGDKAGVPASAAAIPRQPRCFVAQLTGVLKPTLTNVLNVSFMRDWWQWGTAGAVAQNAGTAAALQILAESQNNALVPMNVDTNSVRTRMWDSHSWSFKDDVSWLKGNHLFQFGGSISRSAVMFNRNDGQVSSLSQMVYQVTQGSGINIPGTFIPRVCASASDANCIASNQQTNWKNFYAATLGLVDSANILGTRAGDGSPNPLGAPTSDDDRYMDYSLYLNDSWHVKPTLTINAGLNWSADPPPIEINGKQSMMVYASSGQVVSPANYLQQRQAAALQGQVFNPVIGFEPIKSLKRKYPWDPVWSDFAPRVALAWNPHFDGGLMAKIFGNSNTVIRGGYGMTYDRLNGVQKVINGLQGIGFQQTLSCIGPNTAGACMGIGKTDPSSAFRIGVNGSQVNPPPLTGLTQIPLIPGTAAVAGATQSQIPQAYQMDPKYAPGRNHEFDLTIQREVSSNTIIEAGYIGHIAHGIYSPLQLNQVPYFMTLGGQSFAQAYDAVGTALRSGTAASAVAPQAFFESALAGNSICKPNCTAGIAAKYGSQFTNEQVFSLWNNIQPSFVSGPATAATNQVTNMFFWAARASSNYNAGFISIKERNWHGLTMNANLTYAHSLDNTSGGIQDVDRAVINSYNLDYGYGTSAFDRKFVFNLFGLYQLPFGKNGSGLSRAL